MIHDYLPMNRAEMNIRGWNQCDFVYVSGDAYVDHPSFGHAIITRLLEAHGYRVGIIAQPDWKDPESIRVLGEPRLGFFVSGGNMDSMVNHYSVSKKRRQQDSYTPGGVMGKRPDYATIVYCNLIRAYINGFPLSSAALKPAYGGWPTTITGRTVKAFDSDRLPGGFDLLWNGRAVCRRDCRCVKQRDRCQGHYFY